MPVIATSPEPTHELHGAAFTSLATPTLGDAPVSVWKVRLQPEVPGVSHHLTRSEVIVVLSGSASARIGDTSHQVAAGRVIVVPADVPFLLEATGSQPFEALCVLPLGGQAVTACGIPFTPPWAA